MLWTVHGAMLASSVMVMAPCVLLMLSVRFVVGVGFGSGGIPTSLVAVPLLV